jgi:hypothetical protein
MHALGALSGRFGSGWHGQVECTVGSMVAAPWGIGSARAEGLDGEVTRRGMGGAGLALPGCPRRAQRRPGRRGVAGLVLCHAGSR